MSCLLLRELWIMSQENTNSEKFSEAINMGEAITVELMVSMHCKGCFKAVKKAIDKLDGVTAYKINFQEKKVSITGEITPEIVLKKLKKTGKSTTLIPPPPPPEEAPPAEAPPPEAPPAAEAPAEAPPAEAPAPEAAP